MTASQKAGLINVNAKRDSTFARGVRAGLAGLAALSAVSGLLVSGLAWLIPSEVVVGWAFERASASDEFAQFEALGIAEAGQWAARWLGLAIAGMGLVLWRQRVRVAPWLERALLGFWRVTDASPRDTSAPGSVPLSSPRLSRLVSLTKCVAILVTLILSVGHWGLALRQRFRDWPYYRLHDGDQVLPNISDSNREVIRYLRLATPDKSRILVVSDQKLFFLSYYLRPRQLFHRMHPAAEHLIPRANQARQLAAYRLDELPADMWDCQPDYVLEYFEGAAYVDPARTTEDPAWLAFFRQRSGDPDAAPGYVVRLRRWPFTEVQP